MLTPAQLEEFNAQFILDFPEFANNTIYTDAMLTFWQKFGRKLLDCRRWGTILTEGLELFMAHNLTIQANDIKISNSGGIPGQASGPVAAKKVGEASINYDTSSAMELGAGHWNTTIYGKQYIRLARMVGVGAVQLW